MKLTLSVLDQSPTSNNRTAADAVAESVQLARHCETLNYHRYWLSEHHNSDSIVGTAPEVLMAAIAASTRRIRVGSAGVMLPHYSPLKVAEQFRVLEAIAPGRIDLGLGRAPGSDRLTAYALNPSDDGMADNFPQQVLLLQRWVNGEDLPVGHAFRGIRAHPVGPTRPEMWILGSSNYGAQLAAHLGLPYAYAYFFSDGKGVEEALAMYRQTYQPSAAHPRPQATICVWALAADTEEQARHLLKSREHWRIGFERGLRLPLISPEEAERQTYDAADTARIAALRRRAIVGSGEQVLEKIQALAKELELDEIVINTWAWDPVARRRSYELIARAAGQI